MPDRAAILRLRSLITSCTAFGRPPGLPLCPFASVPFRRRPSGALFSVGHSVLRGHGDDLGQHEQAFAGGAEVNEWVAEDEIASGISGVEQLGVKIIVDAVIDEEDIGAGAGRSSP